MSGRVSGNRPLQQGTFYNEEAGVTLTATRGPNGTARSSGTAAAAQGTQRSEWDEFQALNAAPTPSQTQAAIAARQTEIRGRANELIERARTTPAGPPITIPAQRSTNFREFVDRQHDRALVEGAINTGAAVLAFAGSAYAVERTAARLIERGVTQAAAGDFAAAEASHHAAHVIHQASAAIGTTVAEAPHVAHVVAHPTTAGAITTAIGTAAHLGGELAASTAGGALASGFVALASALDHIHEDGKARVEFQRQASEADRARATALQQSSAQRNMGVQDGHFAAAGRTQINWDLYRRYGDYAAGVNRGLREAARDPSSVAHLAIGNDVPMRLDLSGR